MKLVVVGASLQQMLNVCSAQQVVMIDILLLHTIAILRNKLLVCSLLETLFKAECADIFRFSLSYITDWVIAKFIEIICGVVLITEPPCECVTHLSYHSSPWIFGLLVEPINLQPQHSKNKTPVTADAGNALICSACISGTFVKTVYSHVEALLGRQKELPFQYFRRFL
jgi:hypothetical protein